jgi:hypothetical protein
MRDFEFPKEDQNIGRMFSYTSGPIEVVCHFITLFELFVQQVQEQDPKDNRKTNISSHESS